tara:strand:+ start:691 stop:987 length:297 start_codon:yes stop_codon:yes gene_type:complete
MSSYTPIETELKNIKLNLSSLQVDTLGLQERLIELRDYATMKGEKVGDNRQEFKDVILQVLHSDFYDVNRYIRYILRIIEDLNIESFIEIENKQNLLH